MKTEKNEIAKKEQSNLVKGNQLLSMQAQSDVVINKSTIQLSRLVLVNPMSSFKKDHDELKDGEIVRSDSFEVVVPKKGSHKFIPLMIKQWFDTYEITSAGKNLIAREKYTGQPNDYDDAKVIKCVTFETYFLDREDTRSLPYVVTFRHGSSATGKKLTTMMYVTNKLFNQAPWACGVTLFTSSRKNKDGKEFEIIDYATDKTPLTKEELSDVENWVASFMDAKIEVINEDAE